MSTQRMLRLVWNELERTKTMIVFAESCTAGMIAATLGKVPGVSRYLCGSAVTYREASKVEWLGVKPGTLRKHSAVSEQTAIEMARGILRRTPEAELSLSVTGHLGPNAPSELDGIVYVAIAKRQGSRRIGLVCCECYHLSGRTRLKRREETVSIALDLLAEVLAGSKK